MQITEVRVKLVEDPGEKKLLAFCTITFDNEYVVRDLKIINGPKGPFVAMPSRKLADRCSCGAKNHLRSRYCNECGRQLNPNRAGRDERGRAKLHTDIAHPINARSRQAIEAKILDSYHREVERSKHPGYRPTMLGADYDEEPTPRTRSRSTGGHEREREQEA